MNGVPGSWTLPSCKTVVSVSFLFFLLALNSFLLRLILSISSGDNTVLLTRLTSGRNSNSIFLFFLNLVGGGDGGCTGFCAM